MRDDRKGEKKRGDERCAPVGPVDGNGELTAAVESYGKGIEEAFGDHFADGCRNIDRIARLPGTVNSKTGGLARVLNDFSHDEPHAIESFPRSVENMEKRGIADVTAGIDG